MGVPDVWADVVDDAATFPPGDSPLPDAVAAYADRHDEWYAGLVGSFVVKDVDVPDVTAELPLSIVVTGGAGAIAGALRLVAKSSSSPAGLEIALRDPDDPVGAARRVVAALDAARAEGLLDDELPTYVELPPSPGGSGWLAAADVVAESELRLKFRTGGLDADAFPTAPTLAGWIDAALDRETPFKCTAGLHNAVRHTDTEAFERPVDRHGFVNVLLATGAMFDGAPVDEGVAILEERDAEDLLAVWEEHGEDVSRARRWFTSFGSCSVDEPRDDLISLGLLEAP